MKNSSLKLWQKILCRNCILKPRLVRCYSIVRVRVRIKELVNSSKNLYMWENLYLHKNLMEKEMFLSLLISKSISAIVSRISTKQATPIHVCVRNLIWFLVNKLRITTTCETLIIKQPNLKIINTSYLMLKGMSGRKGYSTVLDCWGDWNYIGSAEVFCQIFKTANGSK